MLSEESRFRRLSRAITSATGALDQSFLGRGRSLGAARVLNAIGQGRTDVADIRAYIGLDSGLMSRFLRGLEGEGLIETHPGANDARKRVVKLTEKGAEEYRAYETLSDEGARKILDNYPDREALLAAMDLIGTVLRRDMITIHEVDPEDARVKHCMEQYYREISDIMGALFDPALASPPDAGDMRRPKGIFLLALSDGLPVGCVAMKGEGGSVGEIRRMWVSPAARGLGLARKMMHQIEEQARIMGVNTLRLDTNGRLHAARRLYESMGWTEIDRYNTNVYAEHFFEKRI